MQDLTGKYPAYLVPSSQEGGNLVQPDLAEKTMTAPGSQPVTPLPPPSQGSHVPEPQASGAQVKVSSPRPQPARTWRPGGGAWAETPDADDQPHPSAAWKQL